MLSHSRSQRLKHFSFHFIHLSFFNIIFSEKGILFGRLEIGHPGTHREIGGVGNRRGVRDRLCVYICATIIVMFFFCFLVFRLFPISLLYHPRLSSSSCPIYHHRYHFLFVIAIGDPAQRRISHFKFKFQDTGGKIHHTVYRPATEASRERRERKGDCRAGSRGERERR